MNASWLRKAIHITLSMLFLVSALAGATRGARADGAGPAITTYQTIYAAIERGTDLIKEGRPDQGIALLRTIVARYPHDQGATEAQYDIAKYFMSVHDYADAKTAALSCRGLRGGEAYRRADRIAQSATWELAREAETPKRSEEVTAALAALDELKNPKNLASSPESRERALAVAIVAMLGKDEAYRTPDPLTKPLYQAAVTFCTEPSQQDALKYAWCVYEGGPSEELALDHGAGDTPNVAAEMRMLKRSAGSPVIRAALSVHLAYNHELPGATDVIVKEVAAIFKSGETAAKGDAAKEILTDAGVSDPMDQAETEYGYWGDDVIWDAFEAGQVETMLKYEALLKTPGVEFTSESSLLDWVRGLSRTEYAQLAMIGIAEGFDRFREPDRSIREYEIAARTHPKSQLAPFALAKAEEVAKWSNETTTEHAIQAVLATRYPTSKEGLAARVDILLDENHLDRALKLAAPIDTIEQIAESGTFGPSTALEYANYRLYQDVTKLAWITPYAKLAHRPAWLAVSWLEKPDDQQYGDIADAFPAQAHDIFVRDQTRSGPGLLDVYIKHFPNDARLNDLWDQFYSPSQDALETLVDCGPLCPSSERAIEALSDTLRDRARGDAKIEQTIFRIERLGHTRVAAALMFAVGKALILRDEPEAALKYLNSRPAVVGADDPITQHIADLVACAAEEVAAKHDADWNPIWTAPLAPNAGEAALSRWDHVPQAVLSGSLLVCRAARAPGATDGVCVTSRLTGTPIDEDSASLAGIDYATGQRIWTDDAGGMIALSALPSKRIAVLDMYGSVTVVDSATGKPTRQYTTRPDTSNAAHWMTADGDRIYEASDQYLFAVSPEDGHLLWSRAMSIGLSGVPLRVGNTILVTALVGLTGISAENGGVLWVRSDMPVMSGRQNGEFSVTEAGNRAVVASATGMQLVDPATGQSIGPPMTDYGTPIVAPQILAADDNELALVGDMNTPIAFDFPSATRRITGPALFAETPDIYPFASIDGLCYFQRGADLTVADFATGAILRRCPILADLDSCVIADQSRVYLISNNGMAYAFPKPQPPTMPKATMNW